MLIHSHIKMVLLFILGAVIASPAQALTPAQVGPVVVLVHQESVGTDNRYNYLLAITGPVGVTNKLLEFSVGSTAVDPSSTDPQEPSVGTLTRLPTGTLWGMAPELSLDYPTTPTGYPALPNPAAGFEVPIPAQGSIQAYSKLRAEIGGAVRSPGLAMTAEDIADERYVISWIMKRDAYGTPDYMVLSTSVPPNTAIRMGQLGSVLVPQNSTVGPGSVGSAADYTAGEYEIQLWSGIPWADTTQRKLRGRLIVSPSALVSFSSDIPGSETNGLYTINTTAASPVATITANIMPLHMSETVPTIRLESIICFGECTGPTGQYDPTPGISGAAFGTDDRTFQLQGYVTNDTLVHSRYFMVTYLATSVEGTNRIYSGILFNVTGIGPPPPPGIPSSITVPATTTIGTYTISWGAATGYVTHYELQEGTEPLFSCYMPICPIGQICILVCKEVPTIYSGPNLSFNFVPNLKAPRKTGTLYYRVRACNATGCSAYRTGSNGIVFNVP